MSTSVLTKRTYALLAEAQMAVILLSAARGVACVALLDSAEAGPSGAPLRGEYRVMAETDALPYIAEGRMEAIYRCKLGFPLPARTVEAYRAALSLS